MSSYRCIHISLRLRLVGSHISLTTISETNMTNITTIRETNIILNLNENRILWCFHHPVNQNQLLKQNRITWRWKHKWYSINDLSRYYEITLEELNSTKRTARDGLVSVLMAGGLECSGPALFCWCLRLRRIQPAAHLWFMLVSHHRRSKEVCGRDGGVALAFACDTVQPVTQRCTKRRVRADQGGLLTVVGGQPITSDTFFK